MSLNFPVLVIARLNVLFPLRAAKNAAIASTAFVIQPMSVCNTGMTAVRIGANAAPHDAFSPCKDAFSSLMLFFVSGSFSA